MKKTLLAMLGSLLLLWAPSGLSAATPSGDPTAANAVLSSVSGTVTLKNKAGKSRKGLVGAKVYQGETVKVGKAGKATLTLFDGSALELQSNTQIVLSTLKKASEKEKNLKFKLSFGELVAKVKKLLTPTSSFEVEAGGAICGVRGTEFSMFFDPATGKVNVLVIDGTVWTSGFGQNLELHGGQGGSFHDGTWSPNQPPATGQPHVGFIGSNPFQGFNGTGQDDLNNPLVDLPGGIAGVTGQVGNNGTVGLPGRTAPGVLNVQLHFPQYLP